jgi:kynurenine formamidase
MIKFPYTLIDLTHTLDESIPSWDDGCGFKQSILADYKDSDTEIKFRVHTLAMRAGVGTHMDAPAHCTPDGATIDKLSLAQLIVPCVVIDVRQAAHERYSVSVEDILQFEKNYNRIEAGSFVMIRTGWGQFWHDPKKYRNNHLFPAVAADTAELLLERDIAGLGIDTLSPDRPEDGFLVHKILLGAGKYLVENAANLAQLPEQGSFILTMPIKLKHGTEAPVRLVGMI